MDPFFADATSTRVLGGEKKRNEVLQMAILEPELAVLDETDSGLDIDALRIVAKVVRRSARNAPTRHPRHHPLPAAARRPDARPGHLLVDGRIVAPAAPSWPRSSSSGYSSSGVDLMTPRSTSPPSARTSRSSTRPSAGPARLPRLGFVVAEAATRCSTRCRRLRDDARQRAPRRLRHRGGGHRAVTRTPARRSPASSARESREIVFTKNVTEAINLVAYTWGRANLHEGDAILLTEIEHHANFVPWLMLRRSGASRSASSRSPRTTARPHRPRPAHRRREARRRRGDVERARHAHPDPAARRRRPRGRRAAPRRRRAVHAPPGHRRRRDRLDFYGFTGHKLLGPPASACCGPGPSCSTPCRRSSAAAR